MEEIEGLTMGKKRKKKSQKRKIKERRKTKKMRGKVVVARKGGRVTILVYCEKGNIRGGKVTHKCGLRQNVISIIFILSIFQ